MREIGERVTRSIMMNFREGGRPVKWKPSQRSKNAHISKKDGKSRLGKTLIDTGKLMRSIHYKFDKQTVTVGTNIAYASTHQFGAKKNIVRKITQAFGRPIKAKMVNVSAHKRNMTINIEARPFLMLQDSDKQYITDLAKKYIVGNL